MGKRNWTPGAEPLWSMVVTIEIVHEGGVTQDGAKALILRADNRIEALELAAVVDEDVRKGFQERFPDTTVRTDFTVDRMHYEEGDELMVYSRVLNPLPELACALGYIAESVGSWLRGLFREA